MKKEIQVTPELKLELKKLLKAAEKPGEVKRIQSVYLKMEYGYSLQMIADIVGYHPDHVKRILRNYRQYGKESLKFKKKGGRRQENIPIEEEVKLLSEFTEKATEGGILEVSKIKDAYEKKVGKKVYPSTVYRMLSRHGWRKIAPRPHHPQNDDEVIDKYKKTSIK